MNMSRMAPRSGRNVTKLSIGKLMAKTAKSPG
jgi:hypothetical protein